MERVNIENYGLKFKQIVSGPAQVGRILNYTKLIGENVLKHKDGNRDTKLKDNVGCAWTTEFMIGLGIAKLGAQISYRGTDAYFLELTAEGKKLYNAIKDVNENFDEGSNVSLLKIQVDTNCKNAFSVFENLFRKSVVFNILKYYLRENGYIYKKTKFNTEYFNELKEMYDTSSSDWRKNIRRTSLSTGDNRVPSLIQLCVFFGYVLEKGDELIFIKQQFEKDILTQENTKYEEKDFEKAMKQEDHIIKEIENLSDKYGIDGTVAIEAVVRNSYVQRMFRNNLILEYGSKCMICGITNEELLIASHIKPASKSNVYDKININNGLLLCANHDKLFDKYLISFSFMNNKMEVSKKVSMDDRKKLGIDKEFVLDDTIMNVERKKFMTEHNFEFHQVNKE